MDDFVSIPCMLNPLKVMVVVDEHLHDSTCKNSGKTIKYAHKLVILDGEKNSQGSVLAVFGTMKSNKRSRY